jgi:hypothetical protein
MLELQSLTAFGAHATAGGALLLMVGWLAQRALIAPSASPDRLVAELRLAQVASTVLAFVAAPYVGIAALGLGAPGMPLDVAAALGFGIIAATASWWDPRTALTALAAAFVGHALVDLAHRPGLLPPLVPRWYGVGCALHNLAAAALCYLPILRR